MTERDWFPEYPVLNRQRHERAKRIEAAAKRAIDLLDRHLGDTDPCEEPDEHEDPVFWACRVLVAALAAPERERIDGGTIIRGEDADLFIPDEAMRRLAPEPERSWAFGENPVGFSPAGRVPLFRKAQ